MDRHLKHVDRAHSDRFNGFRGVVDEEQGLENRVHESECLAPELNSVVHSVIVADKYPMLHRCTKPEGLFCWQSQSWNGSSRLACSLFLALGHQTLEAGAAAG